MDWLQKALDKSKQSDTTGFQFHTSPGLNKSYFQDNTTYTSDISNPAKEITPPNPGDERSLLTKKLDRQSVAAYNFLSAKTIQMLKGMNANSLAVTSPTSGSGNTLTAANLAISITRALHETVVLVELDLHKPTFYRYFGLDKSDKGLSDHLTDNISLQDLLIKLNNTDLTLLPAGTPIEEHPNILGSPQMRQFVSNISSLFHNRLIIFDLPSLLDTEDALAFLPNVDASILVLEEGINTSEQTKKCIDLLKNHGLLGTILNKAKDSA